jgi:hypothetical protein
MDSDSIKLRSQSLEKDYLLQKIKILNRKHSYAKCRAVKKN